jgi:3-methylcrotonyl-CoA carboxylase alpha subunit
VPGRVSRVLVRPGELVTKNAPLVVIEAMKMELTLRAPMDGRVESVRHQAEEMVEEGTELVTFEMEAASA